jgi:threonine/homoserine/homoserine lactone efflux protein
VGEAIGQVLVLAVAVAISPVPIIGVVVMLVTPGARVNGPAFLVGWLAGLAIIGAVVLVAAPGGTDDDGTPATWATVLKLVLGLVLVWMAVGQWRSRPRAGAEAPAPKWMGAVDHLTAPKAAAAGVALSAANPKNLVLAIGAAAGIAQTDIPGGEQALAYLVFVLIGTLGVAVPVAIFLVVGEERAAPILGRLKTWMGQNSNVIMAVLLLVIGAKLVGDAVSGLSA